MSLCHQRIISPDGLRTMRSMRAWPAGTWSFWPARDRLERRGLPKTGSKKKGALPYLPGFNGYGPRELPFILSQNAGQTGDRFYCWGRWKACDGRGGKVEWDSIIQTPPGPPEVVSWCFDARGSGDQPAEGPPEAPGEYLGHERRKVSFSPPLKQGDHSVTLLACARFFPLIDFWRWFMII